MKKRLFESKEYTNRKLWRVLPDNSWKGKPCFIIGGGPSLSDFNWELLKGQRTIGINRAYEKFEPTIIFSMDLRFLNWVLHKRYGDKSTKQFEESKAYKVWLTTNSNPVSLPGRVFIVPVNGSYDKGFKAFSFSMLDGLGHGNNSGYAALNLACCLGANPIYLLGFDMKHEPIEMKTTQLSQVFQRYQLKKSHWHNGHPSQQGEKDVKGFVQYFNSAAGIIKGHKIKVINLNPDSALDCFPKKDYQEVLH